MTRTNIIRRLIWSLASALLGAFLASQAAAAALSISQTPLFITISMPSNIVFLFDDSGSLQWAHVPDWLGDSGTATVYTSGFPAPDVTTTTTNPVVVTPISPESVSVQEIYTTTGVTIGRKSGSKYPYSCPTGYSLNPSSPTSGTSATASGYTCQKPTSPASFSYSCAGSAYTLNPSSPTTGTSSTASGYTCTSTSSTYTCASGYTESSPWTSSGTSYGSDTCSKTTTAYTCPTGDTSSGSGSSTTCTGWYSFGATIDIPDDSSSGPVYAPDTNHYKCACYNPLYYDPTQTYLPGYSDSGTPLSTSFTAAYVNPYAFNSNGTNTEGTLNLSTSYEATVDYPPNTSESSLMGSSCSSHHGALSGVACEVNSCNGNFTYSSSRGTVSATCQTVHNPQTAFYYTLTPTSASAVANGCGAHTYVLSSTTYTVPTNEDDTCLTEVVVSATSGPGGTDERQNFANWFSFYRTRNLTVNTGANRALTNLGSNFRVAWRDLNTMTSSSNSFENNGISDWAGNSFDNRIATFSGSHRTALFDWLERYPANNGTGLRSALDSIGSYYETPAGISSPFAFNPQVTDTPEYVCRPNYAVVFTDGLWNDSSIPSSPSISNNDNTAITLPDGTSFTAGMHPYSDSNSQSMADIAFYFWSHTLRSDLGTSTALQYMPDTKAVTVVDSTGHTASLIPYWNPANDPASWPHMITFTVGLGMTSTITSPAWGGSTYAGGYGDLVTGNIAWPSVSSGSSNNVYDLWHTAIDSRGQFFSVDTPQDVATAFNDIVTRIQGRVGSSSAIAVNSTRLDSDTYIYQAQFNSGGWTGEVLAFPINTDGSIGNQAWAASSLIPSASSRSIYTWDDTLNSNKGAAVSFLWSSLNAIEQANLNTDLAGTNDGAGLLRLNYLRGDQTQEQTQGGNFRTRSGLLGDIVDSNPEYVGAGDFGDSALPGTEGSSYSTFVAGKSTRTPMLYVGANDGMMHGFNANTGVEVFDYVPRGVYPNLSALTDPDYAHQFYVDGSDIAVDAYISGVWKTLLVGSTGAGAKEVYLMDVSDPGSFSTTSVLWDYDGGTNGDANMGYSIPAPTVARMHDGDWYVIFGNGYNSTNQHAVLYMYNIRTQTVLKFDTGVGSVAAPNGMSAPNPVDFNGDRIVDAIYAGDLQGNVWKLDVSSSSASNWKYYIYATSGSTPKPLFTATDSNSNVQPITDRVQVGLDSSGQVMVYFGTGTYFETTDNTVGTNPPVMSFYGVIDDAGNLATDQVVRSNLLQQFVVGQSTVDGNNFRITTSYAMTSAEQGWFIDLDYPSAQGERVVSDAVLDNGRVIFTTLIPQGNACQFGGISWLMELNSSTGGSLTTISPFDVNGDGKVNSNDYVTVSYTDPVSGKTVNATVPVGGIESNVGIIKTPGIVTSGNMQYKYSSGSTGSIMMTPESAPTTGGRISWQEVQ